MADIAVSRMQGATIEAYSAERSTPHLRYRASTQVSCDEGRYPTCQQIMARVGRLCPI